MDNPITVLQGFPIGWKYFAAFLLLVLLITAHLGVIHLVSVAIKRGRARSETSSGGGLLALIEDALAALPPLGRTILHIVIGLLFALLWLLLVWGIFSPPPPARETVPAQSPTPSGGTVTNNIYVVNVEGGGRYVAESLRTYPGTEDVHGRLKYFSADGNSAVIETYVLYRGGGFWKLGQSAFNDHADVDGFFDNPEVRQDLQRAEMLVCVGLASNLDRLENEARQTALSQDRAHFLCDYVARKFAISADGPPLYGFGIGRNQNESADDRAKDDRQRPIVLIGIKSTTPGLSEEARRKEMIRQILFGGKYLGFYPKEYYVVARRQEFCWFQFGIGNDVDGACQNIDDIK